MQSTLSHNRVPQQQQPLQHQQQHQRRSRLSQGRLMAVASPAVITTPNTHAQRVIHHPDSLNLSSSSSVIPRPDPRWEEMLTKQDGVAVVKERNRSSHHYMADDHIAIGDDSLYTSFDMPHPGVLDDIAPIPTPSKSSKLYRAESNMWQSDIASLDNALAVSPAVSQNIHTNRKKHHAIVENAELNLAEEEMEYANAKFNAKSVDLFSEEYCHHESRAGSYNPEVDKDTMEGISESQHICAADFESRARENLTRMNRHDANNHHGDISDGDDPLSLGNDRTHVGRSPQHHVLVMKAQPGKSSSGSRIENIEASIMKTPARVVNELSPRCYTSAEVPEHGGGIVDDYDEDRESRSTLPKKLFSNPTPNSVNATPASAVKKKRRMVVVESRYRNDATVTPARKSRPMTKKDSAELNSSSTRHSRTQTKPSVRRKDAGAATPGSARHSRILEKSIPSSSAAGRRIVAATATWGQGSGSKSSASSTVNNGGRATIASTPMVASETRNASIVSSQRRDISTNATTTAKTTRSLASRNRSQVTSSSSKVSEGARTTNSRKSVDNNVTMASTAPSGKENCQRLGTHDLLLLQNRLALFVYVNARGRESFSVQERQAEEALINMWLSVEEKRERVSQLQEHATYKEYCHGLDHQLKAQTDGLSSLRNTVPRFADSVRRLARAVDTTLHRMPVPGVVTGDQAEEDIAAALSESRDILRDMNQGARHQGESVINMANYMGSLNESIATEAEELQRLRAGLSSAIVGEAHERSMVIERIENARRLKW